MCRAFGAPLTIEEVQLAPPGRGELRVKVDACAICHSDLTYMDGGWGGELPAVYGHEAAGRILDVGPGVSALRPGDNVVVTLVRHCGTCRQCAGGHQALCTDPFPLDTNSPLTGPAGESIHQGLKTAAFAEEVVVHQSQVCAFSPEIPMECAALLACGVLTGLGAVFNTVSVPAGACVAVIGAGGVGINSIQASALAGADPIIALDISQDKLKQALAFGATHAIDSSADNALRQCWDMTGKQGADFVFITVGLAVAVNQGIALLGPGGTAVVVGIPPSGTKVAFEVGELTSNGVAIVGSKMGSARIERDIPRFARLYQEGRLKLDELISRRYPLSQINEAIASVRRGQALRNVITF